MSASTNVRLASDPPRSGECAARHIEWDNLQNRVVCCSAKLQVEQIKTLRVDTDDYYVLGLFPNTFPDGYAFRIVPPDLAISSIDKSQFIYQSERPESGGVGVSGD